MRYMNELIKQTNNFFKKTKREKIAAEYSMILQSKYDDNKQANNFYKFKKNKES